MSLASVLCVVDRWRPKALKLLEDTCQYPALEKMRMAVFPNSVLGYLLTLMLLQLPTLDADTSQESMQAMVVHILTSKGNCPKF